MFNEYLGCEIVRMEGGEAEIGLELAAHHLNKRGVAHGGASRLRERPGIPLDRRQVTFQRQR